MNRTLTVVATLLGLSVPVSANAQMGCPPGKYPIAGQGWNYCADVPGATGSPVRGAPPASWRSRWVALSTDLAAGVLGTGQSSVSGKRAKEISLLDCESKGGADCRTDLTVENGCLAVSVGAKMFNTDFAETKRDAEEAAMKRCNGIDTECHVYYSECAFPEKI